MAGKRPKLTRCLFDLWSLEDKYSDKGRGLPDYKPACLLLGHEGSINCNVLMASA